MTGVAIRRIEIDGKLCLLVPYAVPHLFVVGVDAASIDAVQKPVRADDLGQMMVGCKHLLLAGPLLHGAVGVDPSAAAAKAQLLDRVVPVDFRHRGDDLPVPKRRGIAGKKEIEPIRPPVPGRGKQQDSRYNQDSFPAPAALEVRFHVIVHLLAAGLVHHQFPLICAFFYSQLTISFSPTQHKKARHRQFLSGVVLFFLQKYDFDRICRRSTQPPSAQTGCNTARGRSRFS